jgi:hypothetical protein
MVSKPEIVVTKSKWGWTATHALSGKEIAHSHEKTLLLGYLKDCGLAAT